MTVQELINKAVRLIDDYPNISDYDIGYFDCVTTIVTELMRLEIGIVPNKYKTRTPETPDYTPGDDDYTPVALPDSLTSDSQIIGVNFGWGGSYDHVFTETHDGSLYLLVPTSHSGDIVVKYMDAAPEFTSATETIPISDEAANTVAIYGLAEMFAKTNSPEYTEMMASKYLVAKATWRRRVYNKKRIRASYNI